MTPAEILDLIIKKAPGLRSAGVTSVAIEGASFSLEGQPLVVEDDKSEDIADDLNPLNDPETFGMRRDKNRKLPSITAGGGS